MVMHFDLVLTVELFSTFRWALSDTFQFKGLRENCWRKLLAEKEKQKKFSN
jgi:hypothetical protein